ncbi:MAG: ribosomal RNA small subunit methyltransferase A [Chloroflexi bacterium]|nr:ribosomal RNA small subunit methyltransferase A [Chloroflexota bacterium]
MAKGYQVPTKSIDSSSQVKRLLRQAGLKAKKRLGQHFLVDRSVLGKIIHAAELSPQDTVVEVGPGLGVLTSALAQKAGKVIAVELDAEMAERLKERMLSQPNVQLVNADILKVDLPHLIGPDTCYKVVANLPYYITSPILRYFMENQMKPSLMVVMVQKEVAESIVARSGKMSLLAVSLHVYSRPIVVARVPARSFYPQPKVDSAVVRFDILPEPAIKVADMDGFFDVVRRGFSAPRKQLRNSLANGYGVKPAKIDPLLEHARIEPQRRAETLSLEEWGRLYKSVAAEEDMGKC